MNTHNVSQCLCPTCGYQGECASQINSPQGHGPKPGQIAICFKCGEALVFQEDMTVRAALLNDILGLSPEMKESLEFYQGEIRKTRPIG